MCATMRAMRLRSFASLAALFSLVVTVGCSSDPPAAVLDAAADLGTDLGSTDAPADAIADGSVDGGAPDASGCTVSPDSCGAGEYCDPATRACQRGCRDDEGCRGEVADDGGVAPSRCNVATHTCVRCTMDAHCPSGMTCAGNTCVVACAGGQCPSGQTCCEGACVDTQANAAHCGACGSACAVPNAEPACAAGRCGVGACTGAFRDCDGDGANGCEADTRASLSHCGGCGRACAAAANSTPTCVEGACGVVCAEGFGDCDGDPSNGCEVDLRTTATSCGRCDARCEVANGVGACVAGACAVAGCSGAFGDCDNDPTNGCETSLATSAGSCGTCGAACARLPRADAACVMGSCTLGACDRGYADCDGDPANGCETDLFTDGANCGRCANSCVSQGGTASCVDGQCALSSCRTGFGDCDGNTANGCETETRGSLTHCGACNRACATPNATPACIDGRCEISACSGSFGDCDGMAATGCEADLRTSVAHCGTCGRACVTPNATPVCRAGACAVGSCDAGFADCDGDPSNGCEVDTRTSVGNCGACGRACAAPNGVAACVAGACAVASCATGFANCDGMAANGCEAVLATDEANCGRCGVMCPVPSSGSAECRAGVCGISACPAGRADCDGNVANGCEVTTGTDVNHCGACNNRCAALPNATVGCAGGLCRIASCNAGFADCDGNPANGCEVDTRTSVGNCGACGRACAAPNGVAACVAGACAVASCSAGFANCDGLAGNGCEVDTRTSLTHCGACNAGCAAPTGGTARCAAGVCTRACPTGQTNCNGVCRATGAACTSAGTGGCQQTGTIVCSGTSTACSVGPRTSGACTSPAGGSCDAMGNCVCASGSAVCSGRCQDITTSVTNCGACGRVCAAPTGGTVRCEAGTCVPSCPTGQSNCNGVCRATGAACTSAGTGGCQQTGTVVCASAGNNTTCSATPRTSGSCTTPSGGGCNSSGTCVCPTGQTSCANRCVDVRTDVMNCGACGVACSAGRTCANGVCIAQGALRFTLTWDRNGDEDLLVASPGGCVLRTGSRTGCGGVFERDDTGGTGPENVYWATNPPAGTYTVCVIPYAIARGETDWRVDVVRSGTVVRTFTGTHSTSVRDNRCPSGFSVGTFSL